MRCRGVSSSSWPNDLPCSLLVQDWTCADLSYAMPCLFSARIYLQCLALKALIRTLEYSKLDVPRNIVFSGFCLIYFGECEFYNLVLPSPFFFRCTRKSRVLHLYVVYFQPIACIGPMIIDWVCNSNKEFSTDRDLPSTSLCQLICCFNPARPIWSSFQYLRQIFTFLDVWVTDANASIEPLNYLNLCRCYG